MSSITILLKYIRNLFISPSEASLDLSTLEPEYLPLGKALIYLGESHAEVARAAENISEGNLLYELSVKNDITMPLENIKSKLKILLEALYAVADHDLERSLDDFGDLSDAFNDMVESIKNGEYSGSIDKNADDIPLEDDKLEENKSKMIEEGLFQQIAHYERLMELSGEMRRFRHDIRNHFLCLDSLLADKQIDKARDYILSITPIVYTSDLVLNTNNYIFDALLSEKIKSAKSKDIKVNVKIGVSRKLKVDNVDWCILIGNAMDNAIEAAEKIQKGERSISITITHKGNSLSTKIENTATEKPVKKGAFFQTTKDDTRNHGMGLKSIAHTVEKYNGVFEADYHDGLFVLFFILCDI